MAVVRSLDVVESSYLGFPMQITETSVAVRTPDGRRLGSPAERHVISQLRTAIAASKKDAQVLIDALEEIDCDAIEGAVLDSKRKETVTALIEPFQQLARHLAQAQLVPLITKAMIAPRTEA